ncbi:hypothetical protein SCLARK_00901 [Spiroplasma clarkii]|uniref:Lipoprotein n=1 Tax=Spiroplasma clarkii TaxID=2139 RepID=A0A1Y0L155_9MOLU|nr:lipoprotein [Spiroplasma clarkii]ARU91510.1 hypothetical protein SCLARK_00901 [Spiroplasma clarkii]ATX70923.1 hypothetical protein SCLAR_v1c06040 [Spiroplasma clarkii]
MKKLLGLLAATGLVASTGSTVIACGETTDSAITTEAIKTAVIALLEEGKSDYTTTALKTLLDNEENAITGVASWTVAANSGVASTAVFTFDVAEGHVLDDDAEKITGTFEIANLLTTTPTKVTIDELKEQVENELEEDSYANIDALNEALEDVVVNGFSSFSATADGTVNATVTFTVAATHEITGGETEFTLEDIIGEAETI